MSAISPATVLPAGCDTRNLQSLGPMTAISAGKIYGLSGERASSTVFDNSQSATPVIAFYRRRAVHLTRDGRLLSVQNFAMGNHEVDTAACRTVFTTWKWR